MSVQVTETLRRSLHAVHTPPCGSSAELSQRAPMDLRKELVRSTASSSPGAPLAETLRRALLLFCDFMYLQQTPQLYDMP